MRDQVDCRGLDPRLVSLHVDHHIARGHRCVDGAQRSGHAIRPRCERAVGHDGLRSRALGCRGNIGMVGGNEHALHAARSACGPDNVTDQWLTVEQ